ncbi:cytochrome P450 [Streptosporangium album]|uniref:Cytochrome P450 n=1 Tax=Streptosporangium album TaxID=47479 RepID=A0A7W7RTP0_9ACTN|nr:cytochrome P450 [Streptosporangium album]MBB4937986.1 cytochrome P450 [Streptosporangium album]
MTRSTAEVSHVEQPPSPDQATMRVPLPPELTARQCPFDPPQALARMHGRAPVNQVKLGNDEVIWLVTGMSEARAVLSDPRFSADRFSRPNALISVPEEMREKLFDARARAGQFITMDAPEHTRLRKMVIGQFTLRRMRALIPHITEIVDAHLDAMADAGTSADLVSAFALPVPSLVICELLGVPYEARADFQRRTAALLRMDTPLEETLRVREEMRGFMHELVAAKRAQPDDGLISGLIHGDHAGELTDDELVGVANLLLVAGHETTANMIGLGVFALLEHPDQLELLRRDPELTASAVEELLRYLSIVHLGPTRIATEDVRVGDELIPAGGTVMISTPEINRDSAHWDDPAALDLTRMRNPHLAFGHGIHQCLGQQLARAEMTVALPALVRRFPHLRLTCRPEEVPLRDNMFVYGVHSLPVAWDAPEDA